MDLDHRLRLRKAQHVQGARQSRGVVGEQLATEGSLVEAVGLQHCAASAIDDGDAAGKHFAKLLLDGQ